MDNKYILGPNGELYHWGIKGMKWGIRRYQNPDGSLTAAGQKRYDDKLNKLESKTAKLRAKQQAKDAIAERKNKLKAAKQELEDVKKGKKPEVEKQEKPVEDDAAKRERILKNPNPKEIVQNRHLFNDKEIQSLRLRLQEENMIKSMIPEDVDRGQEFINKFTKNATQITTVIDNGSKAWNSVAKVYNSFFAGKTGVEMPTISDKTASKLDKFKDETDWIKAKNDRKKAEDESKEKEKSKLEKLKEETAWIDAQNKNREAKRASRAHDEKDKNERERAEKAAAKEAEKTTNANSNAKRTNERDNVVYEGTVEGFSRTNSSTNSNKSDKSSKTTIDAEWWEVTSDTSVSSMTKTSRNYSSGKTYISGYMSTPIAGLLPAPKVDDD